MGIRPVRGGDGVFGEENEEVNDVGEIELVGRVEFHVVWLTGLGSEHLCGAFRRFVWKFYL